MTAWQTPSLRGASRSSVERAQGARSGGDSVRTLQLAIKAVVERVLAALAIVALAPVGMALALAVGTTSKGPILYRRRVLGRFGTPFDAFKFRTMIDGAEAFLVGNSQLRAAFDVQFKLAEDPRVTGVGRVLRRYSLDELPQLVNVVRGEMALVGPRMISPEELARYGVHQAKLLSIRPGMTGLWQTSGRQTIGYDERVRLDMEYIDRWSLALDLRILFRTFKAVIRPEGAY
jgi:lipopolysaccharide/colanic/teichoic acid biosynthesis glycosyltransferase